MSHVDKRPVHWLPPLCPRRYASNGHGSQNGARDMPHEESMELSLLAPTRPTWGALLCRNSAPLKEAPGKELRGEQEGDREQAGVGHPEPACSDRVGYAV